MNESWDCPQCVTLHTNTYGLRPLLVPRPEDVRLRAYFLWEAAGCPNCDGVRFWLAAERELAHTPTFALVRVD